MSFPGKKAGTSASFGNPTRMVSEHVMSKPPMKKAGDKNSMACYANIEGSKGGESSMNRQEIGGKKSY